MLSGRLHEAAETFELSRTKLCKHKPNRWKHHLPGDNECCKRIQSARKLQDGVAIPRRVIREALSILRD